MPVLLWSQSDSGAFSNRVRTTRRSRFGAEEHRPAAEALDREIDRMLDSAHRRFSSAEVDSRAELEFVRRWNLGRVLADSRLLESPDFEPGEDERTWNDQILWEALRTKCRLGVRVSGEIEPDWQELIPAGELVPKRPEHDVFRRGLWLQEQDLPDAQITFGSSLSNANELHRRGPSSHIKMRRALHGWLLTYDEQSRAALTRTKHFETMCKALAKRWPGRGPGSAKQPVHYPQDELDEEVRRVLEPVARSILSK